MQTATARKTAKTRYMEQNPSYRKMKVSNLKKTMNYLSKNICEEIQEDLKIKKYQETFNRLVSLTNDDKGKIIRLY